jgi:hypothetical protein
MAALLSQEHVKAKRVLWQIVAMVLTEQSFLINADYLGRSSFLIAIILFD